MTRWLLVPHPSCIQAPTRLAPQHLSAVLCAVRGLEPTGCFTKRSSSINSKAVSHAPQRRGLFVIINSICMNMWSILRDIHPGCNECLEARRYAVVEVRTLGRCDLVPQLLQPQLESRHGSWAKPSQTFFQNPPYILDRA